MAQKFYISDCHFGHKNVLQFDQRPFDTVEEMDRVMMENWKKRVGEEDEVYILGDFCYRSEKDPVWYLKRLPGKKYLLTGNHDADILKSHDALMCFESVEQIKYVDDNGKYLCLCHFPIAEWYAYHRGTYHIYGHIHNRLSDTCLIMRNRKHAYNAAACINNYVPGTLEEIIANNQQFAESHPLGWKDFVPVV
ncbi:MAG: metallophosphoesterase [Lachnospiraceae bacterium]|nr:metallophosphoesterase [Lachnospiraceae bacterium]